VECGSETHYAAVVERHVIGLSMGKSQPGESSREEKKLLRLLSILSTLTEYYLRLILRRPYGINAISAGCLRTPATSGGHPLVRPRSRSHQSKSLSKSLSPHYRDSEVYTCLGGCRMTTSTLKQNRNTPLQKESKGRREREREREQLMNHT
jgi:hypothetical protein